MNVRATTALAGLLAVAPGLLEAATIAGHVTTAEGKPVAGALVTAWNAEKTQKETAYTAGDGAYRITVGFPGKITVRARLPYYKDATVPFDTAAPPSVTDFHLVQATDPQTIAEQITAAGHLTSLEWTDPALRRAFVSQCNYCHQVGNALTRIPRAKAQWAETVGRMGRFMAMLTDREADAIAEALAKGFTDAPPRVVETYDVQPELAHARVHEWLVGDGYSFVHDTMVGADGRLYGTDEGHDILWVLDRSSGKIEKNPLPDVDLPVGGMFSGLQLPLGVFTGKHGPHSMVQTKDGRIWFTASLSSMLGSFDPATRAFKMYPLGRSHLYPHTIRLDHKGIIWFTCVAGNEVVRFDPSTEAFTFIALPHNGFWRWVTDMSMPAITRVAAWFPRYDLLNRTAPYKMPWTGQDHSVLNFPYGIDVDPVDGTIWYAKLYVNKIGRIDPTTLAVTEYDTPLRGPRRPRFDAHGMLWIPAFDDSGLMRFDPATATFRTWKLPLLAPNEYEVPYALNVHPKTGDVWITSNMSDRVFRFIPATERFITYPSPTRVTWMRDFDFTPDGQACSSNSNLPAYGIEDGVDSFVCIDPVGADREAAVVPTQ